MEGGSKGIIFIYSNPVPISLQLNPPQSNAQKNLESKEPKHKDTKDTKGTEGTKSTEGIEGVAALKRKSSNSPDSLLDETQDKTIREPPAKKLKITPVEKPVEAEGGVGGIRRGKEAIQTLMPKPTHLFQTHGIFLFFSRFLYFFSFLSFLLLHSYFNLLTIC